MNKTLLKKPNDLITQKMHLMKVRFAFMLLDIHIHWEGQKQERKECLIVINYICCCKLHVQLTKTSCAYPV